MLGQDRLMRRMTAGSGDGRELGDAMSEGQRAFVGSLYESTVIAEHIREATADSSPKLVMLALSDLLQEHLARLVTPDLQVADRIREAIANAPPKLVMLALSDLLQERLTRLVEVDLQVLVVEDEFLARNTMAYVLREQGFHVFEAEDAEEAVAILKAVPVDAVVTDLRMRTLGDGTAVAEYVRAHCPAVPIILASVQVPPISEHSLFDAFFIKPFKPEDIATWIKRHHTTPTTASDIDVNPCRPRT
jgi:CheY-like chemotaxis protein